MTRYNLPPILPRSLVAQDAKEKRRRVLEAVRKRRATITQRFQKKMQLQANSDLDTIAELL